MTIKINADVVDIRSDSPQSSDNFFVDSNVWFWVGYTRASSNSQNYQTTDYPNYLTQALNIGSLLYKCTLSFAELAHSIERSEWEIFRGARNFPNKKDFRHNFPTERQNVVTEIENAWALVDAMTSGLTLEIDLNKTAIDAALKRMKVQALDGYDLFMIDALQASKITQIITDDIDFGQVSGIEVFTANQKLINSASSQKKLTKR